MSKIDKLSIRGVRSFSPEDEEQVVEFYHPLTVIVGANGCGKTTIIESLRFAVAGALPPGQKGGQMFVHDPRSIGSTSVKANVKLRFSNRADKTMVVVRSMEVAQKKTNATFKQLDGVLRATDGNGQRQNMSHKCTELDRQIPVLLGVSKPILEHVIFCHQEESSWPLQEGAALKKRFDEIFDSQRYTKALDVFAKLKKDYQSRAKDLKAEVAEYRSHRHAAHGYRKDLRHQNEKMEEIEDELASIRQELTQNDDEKKRIDAISEQVVEYAVELEELQHQWVTKTSVIDQQRKMLAEDLTKENNIQQLKDRLREFDEGVESKFQKKATLEEEMESLQRQIEMCQKKRSEIQSDLGRFQAEKAAHERNLGIRFDRMVGIGNKYGLDEVVTQINQNSQVAHNAQSQNASFMSQVGTSSLADSTVTMSQTGSPMLEISSEDMDAFWRAVYRKEEDLEAELQNVKDKRAGQEDEIASSLAKLMGKLQSVQNEYKQIQQEDQELRLELQKIRDQQSGQKLRKTSLEDAKAEAAKAVKERNDANKNPRTKEIPTEIKLRKKEVDELTQKIASEKSIVEDLRKQGDDLKKIEIIKDQCKKDLDDLQEDKNQPFDFMTHGVDPPPSELTSIENDPDGEKLKTIFEKIVEDLEEKTSEKESRYEKSQNEIQKLETSISEKKALMRHDEELLKPKQRELQKTEQSLETARRIYKEIRDFEMKEEESTPVNIPLTENPDQLLDHINTRIEEQEENSLDGITRLEMKKVLQSIFNQSRKTEKCVCCDRSFRDQFEKDMFSGAMKKLAGKDPASSLLSGNNEKSVLEKKAEYENWRNTLKPLMSHLAEHKRLEEECRALDENIRNMRARISETKEKLNEEKTNGADCEGELKQIRTFLSQAKGWVDSATRIANDRTKVKRSEDDLKDALVGDKFGRSLEEVEQSLESLVESKDKKNSEQITLNQELSDLVQKNTALAEIASRKETMLQKMKEKYEEELKAQEKMNQIQKTLADNTAKKDKASGEIAPLQNKIKKKESERDSMRNMLGDDEKNIADTLTGFKDMVKSIKQVVDQIKDFEIQMNSLDGEKYEERANQLDGEIENKQEEIKSMKPALEQITKIVDDQERQKKNLQQNIDLLDALKRINVIKQEKEALQHKLESVEGGSTCAQDKEALIEREHELKNEKARLRGKRDQLREAVMGINRKLSQREYKTVDEDFRQANIKFDTTELAVKDVERYRTALDKALQEYHRKKINEINHMIKELWNLTYKGEDISGIKIVSGADAGSKSTKSYNYRVVMTKGNTEMDMRGRCSAGQRVLASIVIRLALAQSFCVQCGCIALDEPTVNLDYNNKKGLAIALAQIIEERSSQSNFQLILITHDEDFVVMMKNELSSLARVSMPEFYHQVRREEGADGKFYSKIDRVEWEELL
mmetsp:Transcript_31649/g.76800  ORF Transcript_31649/g.76800 Transcript_31649/m.76800 type:complete len:1417 (+) Transcript_31649:548-4798(+)